MLNNKKLPLILTIVLIKFKFHTCLEVKTSPSIKILSETLIKIIEEFYSTRTSSIDINFGYSDTVGRLSTRDILNKVLYKTHDVIASRIEHSPKANIDVPRKFNIFLIDSLESFDRLSDNINNKLYNLEGYFLIVVTKAVVDRFELSYHIFQRLFNLYIINANLIYASADQVDIYSFFPFTDQHCNKVMPVLYNSFRNGSFVRNIDIFPDKLTNFYDCRINVVTWPFGPHIYLRKLEDGTITPEGIDGFILQVLQADLNFSVNYILPQNADDRGTIFPNGTATGAHKLMTEGDGNFTICGYAYTDYRSTFLTASRYYYYTSIVIVKPGQPLYTTLERLFFPFDYIVWWCLGSIFLASYVLSGVLKVFNEKYLDFLVGVGNDSPILQMFATAIGENATILPKRNFGRTILSIWLLANIIVRSSYQGLLFGFLQKTQYKKIPLTLDGLLDEGYKIYAPRSFISIFEAVGIPPEKCETIKLPIEPYFRRTQDPQCKRTLITTNFQIIIYNSENWSRPALDLLPQRVFQLPMVILYKKNSYLKAPFDRTLQKLIGSGLIDHWASLYMNRTASNDELISDPKAITVQDFLGTFMLCGILLVVALFVLIMELVASNWVRLQKIIDFHTY
ncbi:unnamed protein product [Hermetia illucens]|uniref:Putative ionotropic receptor ligand binding domain-containing protein n=1 Tax=Hermetia illucens TaxID=343691 RepID=A0A7R8V0M2_HERIL|nr:uncharacterized protein LOC119658091 [Hermetia illucens]CAD7090650.1 unnamed protein product [Hermetia illucens]